MYWNLQLDTKRTVLVWININMRCIEIQCWQWQHLKADMININMRCIEIITIVFLKASRLWININMRCIEITIFGLNFGTCILININMRCIEIYWCTLEQILTSRLTLTWDVLKSLWMIQYLLLYMININMRCIEIAMQTTGKMAQQD